MSHNLSFKLDVINPQINEVDGRPFMVFYNSAFNQAKTGRNQVIKQHNRRNDTISYACYDGHYYYDDEQIEESDEDSGEDNDLLPDLLITGGNNTPYTTLCHVPRELIGYVLGTYKHNRYRIEGECNCKIVMRDYDRTENLEVRSNSVQSVIRACQEIHFLMSRVRARENVSHFLSFPVNGNKAFERRYRRFVDIVGKSCGVNRRLFQPYEKLHITVALLVLCDQVEMDSAIHAMELLMNDAIGFLLKRNPIKVRLSGLECTNQNPKAATVLYGKVRPSSGENLLKRAADIICKRFVKTGLMNDLAENIKDVKIHVEVMNTWFLQKDEPIFTDNRYGGRWNERKRNTFNATSILKKFGNYDFGEFTINALHLSCPYFTNKSDGYYEATNVVYFT